MTGLIVQRHRTAWDVVLGLLLVVAGIFILGDAAFATKASVLFIGWILLIFGVIGLVASLFRIGKGGFWAAALSSGLMAVFGIFFLRNTGAAALTLTLVAGALFLVSGIVRLAASADDSDMRVPLLLSGIVSTVLGLIILFNLFTASYTLLGILLGVWAIVDGVSIVLMGRVRVSAVHGMPGEPGMAK